MQFLKHVIDFFTRGSKRPIRRLLAYYTVLLGFTTLVLYAFPVLERQLFSGERIEQLTTSPQMLQDGLSDQQFETPTIALPARVELAITTFAVLLSVLLLMLPVSWVYMTSRRTRGYDQSIVQTMIILPLVVAGIVLIVRNSLALAFSLAGIVGGVRFRNTLDDARDAVFIFLAIAVGLSAGVQALTVSLLISLVFNFVVLFIWRSDFGQNVLEGAPSTTWAEPLKELASTSKKNGDSVPDRELAMALTPKKLEALKEKFNRVQAIVGPKGKKRFDSVLFVTTEDIPEAQAVLEPLLQDETKRWKLDEVVSNDGKPSELFYLVRLKKTETPEGFLTAIRAKAGNRVLSADLDTGQSAAKNSK
ncbi:MAG TPA: DUF4956 domain-containing protein [Gemmatimonadales bacterium]|jgi:hypothetical protein|nr:DUF4956 domain-containing protein [Gemmatimonadales bacterium]